MKFLGNFLAYFWLSLRIKQLREMYFFEGVRGVLSTPVLGKTIIPKIYIFPIIARVISGFKIYFQSR